MKRFHKLIGIILSLTMITLISGCGGSSSSSDATVGSTPPSTNVETGVLSLNITDAPLWKKLDDKVVTEVNIAVIDVEYNHDGNWTKATDFNATTFNLIDLQDGKSLHLGDMVLPVGHYTEIRFILAIPEKDGEVKSNPDCNITFEDNSSVPLFVPSGGQSGYKAKVEFDITAEAQIELTADWDASRSVVSAGNSGKYLLKPVIRCVVTELSGWINGTVVDVTDYNATDSLVVYAYKDDNYTEDEPEEFANAVSSDYVNMTDGNFTLPFLGAGLYDLVTAHYDDGNFTGVVDVKEDVEVEIATKTLVDVNTSDYTP